MHTLDLDTLNKDRLISSVDDETYQIGFKLFENGAARVVELNELTSRCTVMDNHYHQILI